MLDSVPWASKIWLCKSPRTCVNKPSTVVNRPPSVPGLTDRLSSGHSSAQLSLFRMSRARSSAFLTLTVILRPFSGISPPVLTSFDLYPQSSQLVFMSTTCRKCGISTIFMFVTHGCMQPGHDARKLVDLVGDDVAILVEAGSDGIRETQGSILLGIAEVFTLRPLAHPIARIRGDEGVTSRVVDVHAEGKASPASIARPLVMISWILANTSGVCSLRASWSDSRSSRMLVNKPSTFVSWPRPAGTSTSSSMNLTVAVSDLDNLAFEVGERRKAQLVMSAFELEGARGLDLIILEAAVVAREGHDNDLAEVRDSG